ncbi:MAG: site-specific DNA-methyltransferase, partial [Candidatus Brocadiae bacterium]|nr:site-specific DNA-methyltransferase [Candidatus Brocadiia bacterium]
FSENSNLPIHRWVPWIAGFSATFVAEVLDKYLPRRPSAGRQTVLDPFAGVGTTPVTAMLRGYAAYAFEINPYAAEAAELKLSINSIPADVLSQSIEEFRSAVTRAVRTGLEAQTRAPSGFNTRNAFFSPPVKRKVLLVQDFIAGLADPLVRKCFRVALASELVGFSNYSYEPSLGTRAAAGKKDVADAPVVRKIARKLACILEDIRPAQSKFAEQATSPQAEFYTGDFFRLEHKLPDGGIDLVITSPPYVNNYHYVRNSRPQVYWLGLAASPKDLKEVEQDSFGKYWQTVRGEQEVPLGFAMPDLEETIGFLRSRNTDKGQYGGPGWANYAATYFNDCHRFAEVLCRILSPGGRAVV